MWLPVSTCRPSQRSSTTTRTIRGCWTTSSATPICGTPATTFCSTTPRSAPMIRRRCRDRVRSKACSKPPFRSTSISTCGDASAAGAGASLRWCYGPPTPSMPRRWTTPPSPWATRMRRTWTRKAVSREGTWKTPMATATWTWCSTSDSKRRLRHAIRTRWPSTAGPTTGRW